MEALQKGLKIIGSRLNSDTRNPYNEDDEISIWPSDNSSRTLIQLRSGDAFIVSNAVFSLELRQKASEEEPTNIIDLGSESGSDRGNLGDDRQTMPVNDSAENQDPNSTDVFTSVDPGLIPATAKNKQIEGIQDGSVDDASEDVPPVAIVSESRLRNDINPQSNKLTPLTHDKQSCTLDVHHEAASIFGHIRHDSHYDDSRTIRATTQMEGNDGNHQCGPVQHVSVPPKSTSLFKDIAQGEVEDNTQDSTWIRVDDLLEKAALHNDTLSSQAARCCNEDAEDAVNSAEHTISGLFDDATLCTEQSNGKNINPSVPLRHSNQFNNVAPHDHQQKEEGVKSSLEPGVKTSNLMDDESTLMDVEYKTCTGSREESSESTIVVQPRVMNGNSRFHVEMPSKVSSASNPRSPTSSSYSDLASSSYGVSSGIDSTVEIRSIKVLFGSSTTVDTMPSIMKILRSLGVRKVDTTNDCDYLCLGTGSIKTTTNLVAAVALGKLVINDKWALSSAKAKKLLDPHDFIAQDRSLETKLGISLAEAIERGRLGHKPFDGYKVFFTAVIKKDLGKALTDLKQIATNGGASIEARLPGSKDQLLSIIISSTDDPQLAKLTANGWRCFTKDLITMTVLRSALDLNSTEFVVGGENSTAGGHGQARGKKRKS